MRRKRIKNKNYINPMAVLDLHGFTKKEAREAFFEFLDEADKRNFENIKIITGQGWHNEDFQSILKPFVEELLDKKNYSYSDAKMNNGGKGAIIVNL